VMGLRAVTAKYGIDGLEQFKKLHQTLDLVILDLTMPKLNGEETFHKLREINKGIPIVLMSGFNEQETIKRFAGMGLAGFIEKPFSADQFMAKVRAAVSSGI